MQANTSSPTSTVVNFPTPSFAPRPRDSALDGPSLSSDQHSKNQSLRKKKGIEEVFVPSEIDFMANNEPLNYGTNTPRPKLEVSNIFQEEPPPPIREIKMRRMNSIGSSGSRSKIKALYHSKKIGPSNLQIPSLQHSRDAESTTSSQRSGSITFKNGRKVRRIVRKVRTTKPTEATIESLASSKTFLSRERKPSISSNKKIDWNASLKKHSELERSGSISVDESKKPFSIGIPSNFKQIKGSENCESILADMRETKSIQIDESREEAESPKRGLLEDIRSSIELNKVMKPPQQTLHSTSENRQCVLEKDLSRQRKIKTFKATSDRSPANLPEPKTAAKCQPRAPNPKHTLLEGIIVGIELKKVDQRDVKSQTPSRDPKPSLLEGIKAGVKLKQVDRTAKTPQLISRDPKSVLLEGIKAGVKLKEVDRALLQTQKTKVTPMSALLANIQKRKQECLRQEQLLAEDSGPNAIDW